MSTRATRNLLFGVIALTLPFAMLGPFDAFVPAVRYVILAMAASAVAAVEGAEGPVPAMILLYWAHALVTLALAWLVAWILARLVSGIAPASRRALVLSVCGLALLLAVAFEPYETAFGRQPISNLVGVLW